MPQRKSLRNSEENGEAGGGERILAVFFYWGGIMSSALKKSYGDAIGGGAGLVMIIVCGLYGPVVTVWQRGITALNRDDAVSGLIGTLIGFLVTAAWSFVQVPYQLHSSLDRRVRKLEGSIKPRLEIGPSVARSDDPRDRYFSVLIENPSQFAVSAAVEINSSIIPSHTARPAFAINVPGHQTLSVPVLHLEKNRPSLIKAFLRCGDEDILEVAPSQFLLTVSVFSSTMATVKHEYLVTVDGFDARIESQDPATLS